MKVNGILLKDDMEKMVYASAYGAEFINISLPDGPDYYKIQMAEQRAATAGRRAVEAFRKMLEDFKQ